MEGKPGAAVGHIKFVIPFRHPCGDVKETGEHAGKKFRGEVRAGGRNLGVVSVQVTFKAQVLDEKVQE